MHPVVAPKNVALCVILSVFIPGLGSIVAGNTGTGVLILVLDVVAWILSIFLIGIPFAIGIWIWGLVDAYKSAERWNHAHGVIS
jgi:TM2 domain-containing membrane protein YozV